MDILSPVIQYGALGLLLLVLGGIYRLVDKAIDRRDKHEAKRVEIFAEEEAKRTTLVATEEAKRTAAMLETFGEVTATLAVVVERLGQMDRKLDKAIA